MTDTTWAHVPDGSDFTLANLPYGVVRRRHASLPPFVATRIGDHVVAIADVVRGERRALFGAGTLDAFLVAGPEAWREVRDRICDHLTDRRHERPLMEIDEVDVALPFTVADYVDFYSSIEHATNLGRILRPGSEPLLPN